MKFGQVLVELLPALGVAALAVTALVGVTTRSISNAGFSKSQSTGSAYATQAMEWIRSEKNADWQTFVTRVASLPYCINELVWPAQAGGCTASGLVGGFSREVKLTVISATPPQQIEAAVTVSWSEAKRDFNSRQTTVFTVY